MTSDRDRTPRPEPAGTGERGARPSSYEPARLRRARILAGRSTAELARAIGVSEGDIERFETGVTTPGDRLAEIFSAVRMPAGYFASGRPMVRLDRADIHFRSMRPAGADARVRAAAYLEQLWELIHALGRRIRLPEPNLPVGHTDTTPVAAARRLRTHWNLPRGPLAHLGATIESQGIVLWTAPPTDDQMTDLGSFSTSALDRPIIAVTSREARSIYEYRLAIAHELGHLLLHHHASPGDRRHEREADQFALELLLPGAELQPLVSRNCTPALLSRLAVQWGVPTRLLRQRAGIIGQETPDEGRGEPSSSYPGETPRLLREAAELCGQRGHDIAAIAAELHCGAALTSTLLGLDRARPRLTLLR